MGRALAIAFAAVLAIPALASPAAANADPTNYPYRSSQNPNEADEWGFIARQCTSYVAWRLVHSNGVREFHNLMRGGSKSFEGDGNHWGNAWEWKLRAERLGYRVDNTPAVGAVAWWDRGNGLESGHVAWVEAVNPDGVSVQVSEYNWNGGDRNYNTRTAWPMKYIHIKDLGSSDARREMVRRLYQELLNREPDPGGWDYWVRSGLSEPELRQRFMGSEEYKQKHGSGSRLEWIKQLYRDFFGRFADWIGLIGWHDSGYSLAQIRDGFIGAPENRQRQISGQPAALPVVVAPSTPPPASASVPTLSSPGNGSGFAQSAQVVLSWNRASNAVAYKVELWGGPYSLMTPCNWQPGISCWIGQMWPGTMYWRVKARSNSGVETAWSDTWSFVVGAASYVPPGYSGPEPPNYAPSFAGQTVSWKGNSFRSDDGVTWIFQGSDAERAGKGPVNPGVFKVLSPENGARFPISQIREFCWQTTVDEQGAAVDYELKINDIVSPERRAAAGATREYVSPRIQSGCYTPPSWYFRAGFDYEWSVEAISRTNTRRVAQDAFKRFTVTEAETTATPQPVSATPPPAVATPSPTPATPSCSVITITPGGNPSRYPNEFRITGPSGSFSAQQIPEFTWQATVDDAGGPVAYKVHITNILSPEQRAANGQGRDIYSPLLCGTSWRPVGVGLEPWGDFEWVVEAVSSSNATRVSANSLRFSVTR